MTAEPMEKILSEAFGVTSEYKMEVHGNRPGDIAARKKRAGDLVPEREGVIIGRELRDGDKVPCREGDIIAGVCRKGETQREMYLRMEFDRTLNRVITQMIESYHLDPASACRIINHIKGKTSASPEPCP